MGGSNENSDPVSSNGIVKATVGPWKEYGVLSHSIPIQLFCWCVNLINPKALD